MTEPTPPTPIAFKAEIRQLLDILIHSLYTDREIFLRELISNASDALNRMRYESLTNQNIYDSEAEYAIHITADKEAKTLTISDSGIGMTAEELTTNLGTIAQSGARAFIEAAQQEQQHLSEIIGQFGVGFYSAFMVAESITVTSRSYLPDAQAAQWTSTGSDTFTVSPAEKTTRGTEVTIHLKEDSLDFAEEYKLQGIIRKHSDFVAFPIYVGDNESQTNQQSAIWRRSTSEVTPEEYEEFYKHLTLEFEPPIKHIHLSVDAPIQMYALLYLPASSEHSMFAMRKEDGLKLYTRKILIQEYTKELLPEYYRFIQGVVDVEDLPLNVSRETVQSSRVIARMKKVLTSRVNNTLKDLAKNAEVYNPFWEKFGRFLKEGVATDAEGKEPLFPLLRFHTTINPDVWNSLDEYIGRMKPDQKKIYFILGEDNKSVVRSPHLDYFQKNDYEVLLLTETIDSFMLMGLRSYEGFDLQNVAAADLELPGVEKPPESEDAPEEPVLSEETQVLVNRFKDVLGERVTNVRTTDRLSDSVARLVDPEGTMGQEMQRVYRLLEQEFDVPKKILELNPDHPILVKFSALAPEDPRGELIIEQIYANALLIEGLLPDPASMIPRIEGLMDDALK